MLPGEGGGVGELPKTAPGAGVAPEAGGRSGEPPRTARCRPVGRTCSSDALPAVGISDKGAVFAAAG
ncbi:hypothetical protein GCM10010327_21760 [Streptomyces nitrosporeus]|nr:hypothetical protein GCM10010327_21760 [Streptomyces nitrosporeus]